MIERDVKIVNKLGLHARPAMQFVNTAKQFKSTIRVLKDEQAVDGKSIMEMMILAATPGTKLRIRAQGPDAERALDALEQLIQSKFDEE